MTHYWQAFVELIETPFQHTGMIWGIVPLYFALLLNELTSSKANFRTAVQTGFSFLWAGAQWLHPFLKLHSTSGVPVELRPMLPIHFFVTFLVLLLGAVALVSGLRRRYPKHCSFLGHTRFANHFMIMIFPMQSRALGWKWDYVAAIALVAIPVWLALHFGLMPLRAR